MNSDLIELAEQILETVYEFEEDGNVSQILEDALDSNTDLEFAIDAGLSYLKDCDCEDYDYLCNKFEQLTLDDEDGN